MFVLVNVNKMCWEKNVWAYGAPETHRGLDLSDLEEQLLRHDGSSQHFWKGAKLSAA